MKLLNPWGPHPRVHSDSRCFPCLFAAPLSLPIAHRFFRRWVLLSSCPQSGTSSKGGKILPLKGEPIPEKAVWNIYVPTHVKMSYDGQHLNTDHQSSSLTVSRWQSYLCHNTPSQNVHRMG